MKKSNNKLKLNIMSTLELLNKLSLEQFNILYKDLPFDKENIIFNKYKAIKQYEVLIYKSIKYKN